MGVYGSTEIADNHLRKFTATVRCKSQPGSKIMLLRMTDEILLFLRNGS